MYSWLVSEIVVAEKHGVEVNVDGRKYSLKNMAELKEVKIDEIPTDLKELQTVINSLTEEELDDSYYMKSYTGDENGKIVRVDFEHIVSV